MTQIANLGISVDTADVDRAVSALDRLSDAAERASAALEKLAGQPHGGLLLESVGEITHLTIKPAVEVLIEADPGIAGLQMAAMTRLDAKPVQRTRPR